MKRLRISPPPLRGRSIRAGSPSCEARWVDPEADREGGYFLDRFSIQLPPSLTLPLKGGGKKFLLTALKFIVALAGLIIVACAARAEVQKFLNPCGGQKLCASYALVLTPPDGWVVDAKATAENKVQILVPKGQSFASAEPLIYVQVFYQADKAQTLADFARASNARWLAANPKATITELPAVERANGKPAFLRFSFNNPGKAQQAYEVGALGVDSDKDGNSFVLDVVMSGNSKAALDRADAAYSAFLKAH
jgi:hypothetical protein